MPAEPGGTTRERVLSGVRSLVRGHRDPRVRATWRVLLAMPVLWTLSGAVLAGNVQSAVPAIPSGPTPGGGFAQSVLHAGFFLVLLAGWARYLDHRPLSAYGVYASRGWFLRFAVGFLAVLAGFAAWLGVAAVVGGTTVTVAPSLPEGSLFWGLLLPFVTLVLHAAVQQVVFFRVVLETAAEGVNARGVGPEQATLAAVPVAVLLFVLMHGDTTPLRALDLAVAGTIFALLFVHSGALGFGIGAHFGALYSGVVVSGLVHVRGELGGVLGILNQYGFPKMLVAYLLVVAWLRWRRGSFPIESEIAQRTMVSTTGFDGVDRN